MKLLALTISTILLSQSAVAQQTLDGTYVLTTDEFHNGLIESGQSQEIILAGDKAHFMAHTTAQFLSGSTAQNGNIIQFKLSNKTPSSTQYFAGNVDINGTFSGTWFAANGTKGDWSMTAFQPNTATSCKDILDAGLSQGDGVYEISALSGEAVNVYCDMTRDGGGWTLVGSYPKSQPGGIHRIEEYGDIPETDPNNVTRLWLYKGDLSVFTDAKEQVSCSTVGCGDGYTVYGQNFTPRELELVRYNWGASDRLELMPRNSDKPSCTTSLAPDAYVFEGCVGTAYLGGNVSNSTVGWQGDITAPYCWVARGTYKSNSSGSAVCSQGNEPNGSQWALLWMR
ncbi:fibrinogen-like YCDxxxxGGGW domain-containing protein [Pseudoalteromonas luteoviolacea]|uniref:Fibrinogen C-terminal domain-containing protein n=1 Tax=Pseudoalteromonas luteoviolacea S4054 TaxID=1129367 RepID=A0A0F6A798_9GAMM|nr:fibrinogen-like YCDxxxxGGGW domain-containing protein [Pseudoalteromonas luteoviolacea]AOT08914.1 hypothetical protein S4054249_14060 [Pseudoalteromonas luteoviolacea]AOT13826.1 hypothetical protein S40542_14030 [Pseudoalteromonas luteoviolacea]AOT18741.1 hypothetical protein S4054_14035 [Pseudoalteromonas luteoviolacea]KKE81726.1 hypothetical protein N479_21080 [Pseudoalteromonas luteoviolacea S4054]KZN68040.1 hypothetical protein N481_23660 [Pseudoalteromonas luteoviolacea S4047-1]